MLKKFKQKKKGKKPSCMGFLTTPVTPSYVPNATPLAAILSVSDSFHVDDLDSLYCLFFLYSESNEHVAKTRPTEPVINEPEPAK